MGNKSLKRLSSCIVAVPEDDCGSCRLAKKLGSVMDLLSDKKVYVVSTVPLAPLEGSFRSHLMLHMSWTQEAHESCVYSNQIEGGW